MIDKAKMEWLRCEIADRLVEIEKLFSEPVKLTVLVRNPAHPDGGRDVLLTSDDFETAIAAARTCNSKGVHVT